MSTPAFGSFIDIVNPTTQKVLQNPPKAYYKNDPTPPSTYELDSMNWGSKYNGPATEQPSGTQTPAAPNDLEMSRPATPLVETSLVQRWNNPSMNKWRVLSACLTFFGNGANDSAPGALIPYMETGYSIGYALVSLIFVTNAVGFIIAAFFTDTISTKLGRSKSLMLSETMLIIGCIMIACTPPFGVVVLAFFFLGFGTAVNCAMNNVFCSNLANSTIILGFAHGCYGVGGIVGPVIATAMVSNGILWSRYYLILIGVRVLCLVFSGWSSWDYEKDSPTASSLRLTASGSETSKVQLLKEALRNKVTFIGALFIFGYQGAEVSISGWVISFLITYRGGDPSKVGYVSAGFWAGITLGRFTLTHVAHRVGEKTFVFAMIAGAAIFQLLLWFVPNVIGDAVAVAIVGLLLGPIYPCASTIFSRLLPMKIQTVSVGFIGSAGSSGGAIAPFATGLLAQAVGTWALHPICVGLYLGTVGCWAALPKVTKRRE